MFIIYVFVIVSEGLILLQPTCVIFRRWILFSFLCWQLWTLFIPFFILLITV